MEEAGRFTLGIGTGGTWLVVSYSEICEMIGADIDTGI